MNFLRPIISTNIFRNSLRCSRNFHSIAANQTRTTQETQRIEKYSTTATIEKPSKGIISKLLGKFSGSRSRMRVASLLLYENVADKVVFHEFFEEFGMPDTFNSWFKVIELHCWLILTRVMSEGAESGEDGRFLRNCIVESMWADVQSRAKKLSAENPSASRRQVGILGEQFQGALIIYDEGLMSDDKILASALWRRFFEMKCEDYSKLEKLVKYVRISAVQLDNMTREELLSKPNIEWKNIRD